MTEEIKQRRETFVRNYRKDRGRYKKFSEHILHMIENALAARQITIAYASAREKDPDSLEKKCKKQIKGQDGKFVNKYTDFRAQIMDLAGVRIVTYLLEDVEEVSKVIRELFKVVDEHSGNKLDLLGADKIGYLSVHYVVMLKKETIVTGEEGFKGLKCEIQVRTVLEDAWAQIFHDRQYKNDSYFVLPENLLRRTNLLSGNLELLDYQINDLVKQYDKSSQVEKIKRLRKVLEQTVSRDSLLLYIDNKFERKARFFDYEKIKDLLDAFDIQTIRQLDALLEDAHCEEQIKEYPGFLTADKIISYMLIINDGSKFFEKTGQNTIVSRESYDFLKKFIDIKSICNTHGIEIKCGR